MGKILSTYQHKKQRAVVEHQHFHPCFHHPSQGLAPRLLALRYSSPYTMPYRCNQILFTTLFASVNAAIAASSSALDISTTSSVVSPRGSARVRFNNNLGSLKDAT